MEKYKSNKIIGRIQSLIKLIKGTFIVVRIIEFKKSDNILFSGAVT